MSQVIRLTEVIHHRTKNPDKICMFSEANTNNPTARCCHALWIWLPAAPSFSHSTV